MEVNETGGEEQVIDQAEVDSIAAALSGSSDDNPEDKKEEPEVVKKKSGEVETIKDPDPIEKEDDPKKENLSNFIDKEEPVPIKQKKVISEAIDGKDFEISDDGKVRIYSQHIVDDIDKIRADAKVYLGIFNSKFGKEKAEVIAKSLGFASDITRSAGAVAKDVIAAYLDAARAKDSEKMEKIQQELFRERHFE